MKFLNKSVLFSYSFRSIITKNWYCTKTSFEQPNVISLRDTSMENIIPFFIIEHITVEHLAYRFNVVESKSLTISYDKEKNINFLNFLSLFTIPILSQLFFLMILKRHPKKDEDTLIKEYNSFIKKEFLSKEDKLLETLVWCSWTLLGLDYNKRDKTKRSTIREFWEFFVLSFDKNFEKDFGFIGILFDSTFGTIYSPYLKRNEKEYNFNVEEYDIDLQTIEYDLNEYYDYENIENILGIIKNNKIILPVLPFKKASTVFDTYTWSLTSVYQELFYEIYIDKLYTIKYYESNDELHKFPRKFKGFLSDLIKNPPYYLYHLKFLIERISTDRWILIKQEYYDLAENLHVKQNRFAIIKEDDRNGRINEFKSLYKKFEDNYNSEFTPVLQYFIDAYTAYDELNNDYDRFEYYVDHFLPIMCYPVNIDLIKVYNDKNLYADYDRYNFSEKKEYASNLIKSIFSEKIEDNKNKLLYDFHFTCRRNNLFKDMYKIL